MEDKVYMLIKEIPGCSLGTKFVKVPADVLPINYSKEIVYYSPEGSIYPLIKEEDIVNKTDFINNEFFEEFSTPLSMLSDLKYLTLKRDFALDHFIRDTPYPSGNVRYTNSIPPFVETMQKRFDTILRLCKRVRLAEDALLAYAITKKMDELNKKFGI